MSFKCSVGIHSWDGCKCSGCGKVRDAEHDIAADCGKCAKCGATFNEDHHEWSHDCEKCSKCGNTRENHHNWLKDCEKCSKCGMLRTNVHHIIDGTCQVCGNGYFKDERDGSVHRIKRIGNQVIMADNFVKRAPKGTTWSYDDNLGNTAKFGSLYTWEAARSLAPEGWHLPTKAEWETLHAFLGGDSKKVYEQLKAGGSSGFESLAGGERYARGVFNSLGASGHYWSDTAEDENNVWQYKLGVYTESAGVEKVDPNFGLSVRFFRNK
jgi:uncharacterized protein (TIGR02145 family)